VKEIEQPKKNQSISSPFVSERLESKTILERPPKDKRQEVEEEADEEKWVTDST